MGIADDFLKVRYNMEVTITNQTMELRDCCDAWFYDENHHCWCLEDIIYTPAAKVPLFQRMSIYAPEGMLSSPGVFTEAANDAPVVFDNNAAGYMQMPHLWLDNPRCKGQQYLDAGFIYVTCGCSGRESKDKDGNPVGKAPATLVDLKTAIRFLRHNRNALPGNLEKIVSVGVSAGGAMSALLGVTGDHGDYLPYLKENGAFLDESDAVFAAQIYCPIIDLEHADLAYEWMFYADKTCEDSHAGPAETMSPFQEALSDKLTEAYISYFNSLGLRDPETGTELMLNRDGRSGSGYAYLMGCLEASATKYLSLLARGKLPAEYSVADYLRGTYSTLAPVPRPRKNKDAHHIGPNAILKETEKPKTPGEMMLRPQNGTGAIVHEPEMKLCPGTDKRSWLAWDGEKASIHDLDSYVLHYRRRMKPCTSFDTLPCRSGENHVFGTVEADYLHFNPAIADAIESLKDVFPEEYATYHPEYFKVKGDISLERRVHMFNPMEYIGQEGSTQAKYFRIRVGSRDADTAATVSMALALKLHNCGSENVDYAIVWDQPHCDADYPGEICMWIKEICK